MAGINTERLLFNHLVVFAPSRAFDVRTDIFYYKVIQGIRNAVSHNEVHLTYCALEETDADLYVAIDHAASRAGNTLARQLARRHEQASGRSSVSLKHLPVADDTALDQ